MASSFHRTTQSLRLDHGIWSISAFLIALALVTAWLVWAFKAVVVRYEVSAAAHVEVAGKLHVVAEFSPQAAFGKIQPGQTAIVKLDAFPWAQFGALPACVSSVAGEIRDGKVRVELTVKTPAGSRIRPTHGMPGSVEVEVERISPAVLLLRSAGRTVGAR